MYRQGDFRNLFSNDPVVKANPSLLFVSPVIPKLTGAGIAMRAGLHVQELASSFAVTLAVILDGQAENEAVEEIPAEISTLCTEIIVASKKPLIARFVSTWTNPRLRDITGKILRVPPGHQRRAAAKELARRLSGMHFDAVHCFRLITGITPGFLETERCSFGRAVLDLDDYESRTKRRYADTLLRAQGKLQFLVGRYEAGLWEALEDKIVPKFDDIYVCSEMDRGLLSQRFPSSDIFVVPNVVDAPNRFTASPGDPFTFLFVGSLGYPPNRDAVLFFCADIVPRLRKIATRPFRVQIVGMKADAVLKNLDNGGDVQVVGAVPDVTPFYEKAGAAIVPLRAGGGTRIKILEAFSHTLPVISTSIGAEGLEVNDGRDILIADTPERFAEECRNLLDDPDLRRRIAAAGHALFQERYTKASLAKTLEMARSRVREIEPG